MCQNSSCAKMLCRKCSDNHDISHRGTDVMLLPEFTKKASRDLEITISSLKDVMDLSYSEQTDV